MRDSNSPAPSDTFTIPDTTGSDFELPSYDLTPEEAEIVAGAENFDPVDDVPSPVEWEGGDLKLPERLTASALPPRFAEPIKAKLAAMSPAEREAAEPGLVMEALRQNAYEVRSGGGISTKAEADQAEALTRAYEVYALEQEAYGIHAARAGVDHWRPVFAEDGSPVIDSTTGQQKIEAFGVVRGDRR